MSAARIQLLTPEEYPDYASMTFPSYRQRLELPLGTSTLVAIGAMEKERPVGLALAEIQQNEAELLSIYVNRDQRGQKISIRLMEALDEELKSREIRRLRTAYMDGIAGAAAFRSLLGSTGWSRPSASMLFLHYLAGKMAHTPWMRPFRTPPACELFPLEHMTDEDKKDYQHLTQQPTFPRPLDYTSQPYPVSWTNSYGLRRKGSLIGWMATHLVSDHTIRYTSLYVEEQFQQRGYALPLIFRAIQTHCHDLLHIPHAIQGIPLAFPSMVRLARNKLQPYAEKEEYSWEAVKELA